MLHGDDAGACSLWLALAVLYCYCTRNELRLKINVGVRRACCSLPLAATAISRQNLLIYHSKCDKKWLWLHGEAKCSFPDAAGAKKS